MAEKRNNSAGAHLEERRLFPRLSASVDIQYNVVARVTPSGENSVSKNISAGGICLIVYEKIEPGSILDLKFSIPEDNRCIEAKGRVIWSEHFTVGTDAADKYDVGIEFTEVSQDDRQKISQYVFRLIK